MTIYNYKATHSVMGTPVHGMLTAESPRSARDMLRARGLKVRGLVALQTVGNQHRKRALIEQAIRIAVRRRPEAHVVAFYRELASLLAAGIPLLQAIDGIVRQQRGPLRVYLMLLRDRIAAGASLTEAMREQPDVFDALSVSMVEVGERAGTLDEVLEQLVVFKHRSHQFRDRLATALIYPLIVVFAGAAVTLFLMTFVVPQLLQALIEAGIAMPLMTRIVKGASDLLVTWWWLVLPAVVTVVMAGAGALHIPWLRRHWHAGQLCIPVLGELIRKQAIARVASALAALTRSGVEFVVALEIVRRSVGNCVLANALQQCQEAIGAGRDIAPALEASGVFPPTLIQIVEVGQATGQLDKVLERLACDYDHHVTMATQRFVAVLEPMLILLLATFIGLIVLSVILPYMEVGNVL